MSLGVDIVPMKTCTQNCIYCELGLDAPTTAERKSYIDINMLYQALEEFLTHGRHLDYITITGSGEPTLNADLGKIIRKIREMTHFPVAILTNGSMLWDPQVRRDCMQADVVLPSLDAPDAETYAKINRPDSKISFEKLTSGLIEFAKEYKGKILLEVLLIEGVNTDEKQLDALGQWIEKINPHKIQVNTAVRPGVDKSLRPIPADRLEQIARRFGPRAEVIASSPPGPHTQSPGSEKDLAQRVLELLKRRPCPLSEIAAALGIDAQTSDKLLTSLQRDKKISTRTQNGQTFYIPGQK